MAAERISKYHGDAQELLAGEDGRGWERMGEDGRGWERMGEDGRGWERMGEDGRGWESEDCNGG
eukprot:766843-Hanusia_phi.AAC.3